MLNAGVRECFMKEMGHGLKRWLGIRWVRRRKFLNWGNKVNKAHEPGKSPEVTDEGSELISGCYGKSSASGVGLTTTGTEARQRSVDLLEK